jgi:hypothetical protein|tara:strand:+ start:516 stop:1259 length:744 start_codon:yes stop_codon:yes gene_type:complete
MNFNKQTLEAIKASNEELFNVDKTIKGYQQNINSEEAKIAKSKKQIISYKKSIEIEQTLKNYPSSGQGSVFFYNSMMSKFDVFSEIHLNKISRYFNYVEKIEEEYKHLYTKATNEYYKNPEDPAILMLYKTYEHLVESYKILFILVSEVDRDKLLYHKVYNQVEDQGIFLTASEKLALRHLDEISKKLSQIVTELQVMISTTNQMLNQTLNAIGMVEDNIDSLSSDIAYMDYTISDVQTEIWGLSTK